MKSAEQKEKEAMKELENLEFDLIDIEKMDSNKCMQYSAAFRRLATIRRVQEYNQKKYPVQVEPDPAWDRK
jgi:hypothetical protein